MLSNESGTPGSGDQVVSDRTDLSSIPDDVKEAAVSVYAQLLKLRRDGFDTFVVGPDGQAKTLRFPFDGPGYMPAPPKLDGNTGEG